MEQEGGRGGAEGREEKGGKGVPECPNPELASLCDHLFFTIVSGVIYPPIESFQASTMC